MLKEWKVFDSIEEKILPITKKEKFSIPFLSLFLSVSVSLLYPRHESPRKWSRGDGTITVERKKCIGHVLHDSRFRRVVGAPLGSVSTSLLRLPEPDDPLGWLG